MCVKCLINAVFGRTRLFTAGEMAEAALTLNRQITGYFEITDNNFDRETNMNVCSVLGVLSASYISELILRTEGEKARERILNDWVEATKASVLDVVKQEGEKSNAAN